MTVNLDDASLYTNLDPEDMFARVGEMPDECARAWQTAADFKLPAEFFQRMAGEIEAEHFFFHE